MPCPILLFWVRNPRGFAACIPAGQFVYHINNTRLGLLTKTLYCGSNYPTPNPDIHPHDGVYRVTLTLAGFKSEASER